MTVQLSHKDIQEAQRLRRCLIQGVVPVNDIQTFLDGLQQQATKSAAVPERKPNRIKAERKNKYKNLIK